MEKKEDLQEFRRKYNPWQDGTPVPTIRELLNVEKHNKWTTTCFFIGENIINPPETCKECRGVMKHLTNPYKMEQNGKSGIEISNREDAFKLRCTVRPKCGAKSGMLKDSFFENRSKSPDEILIFFQLWLAKADRGSITGILNWSEGAVLDYDRLIREVVSVHMYTLVEQSELQGQLTGYIGGENVEVQIDESAFGNVSTTGAIQSQRSGYWVA